MISNMHALVIGATGATGKDLLDLLLQDNSVAQVDIFVRRPVNVENSKLRVHVIDFDQPEQWKHLVKGDVLFSALGTTLKAAGSNEAQWKIDYEYQYQFARAAKENGVNSYVLVSSGLASANSPFFYTKMKGELEESVKALGFPKTLIFNPPILVRKGSDRGGEIIGAKVVSALNSVGLFKDQKPLPTTVLAKAMLKAAKLLENGVYALKSQDIRAIAEANNDAE